MPRHRLFFALFPPAPVAMEMARHGAGRRVADDRLHVTLLLFGDFAAFPSALVAFVRDVVGATALAACRLVFDLLVRGERSTLLMPSEPLRGPMRLRGGLETALVRRGLVVPPPLRPHVTLGYEAGAGPTRAVDPIGWRADELSLVVSRLGATRHEIVGRWPLAG